jgi:hypothetical protein
MLGARQAHFKEGWTFWRGCLPSNPRFRPSRLSGSPEGPFAPQIPPTIRL